MTGSYRFEILIATGNRGKIREIEQSLGSLPVKLRYLEEFPQVLPVAEVGQTYEENAIVKAVGYANQMGLCALADDSGLEVDALGGMPGVFSARFGGDHVSDDDRIKELLLALSAYHDHERTARYVCCMAIAGWSFEQPQTSSVAARALKVTQGECQGLIATDPRGVNGFGFDPVFMPAGYSATFAELPSKVKGKISHRALALAAMREFVDRWLT